MEGRLAQLACENKRLLDQAFVTKQTMVKHAERIRKLERTVRAICELVLESRPKEEETRGAALRPKGPTPQVGLSPPQEVTMREEPFPMPPPTPQLLAQQSAQPQPAEQWRGHGNPSTGLPPTPAFSSPASHSQFSHLRHSSWCP